MAKPYQKAGRWYLRYKDATGRWRDRVSKARTKAEAKLLCLELEQREERVRARLDAPTPVDGGGTLEELLQWWIAEYFRGAPSFEKSIGTVRRHLLGSELSRLRLVEVTPGRIESFLQSRSRDVGPQTLNHIRGYLSRAFSAARRTERFVGPNPVAEVSRRKIPRRVPDYLRPQEIPPLLRALAPKWRALFATGLYTGMRRGELFGLRKSDIDLPNRLITVARSYQRDTTKGDHADAIPIAAELVPYLTSAIATSTVDLVFPADDGSMRSPGVQLEQVLRRAMRRAGLVTGYRHVCRRQGCGHLERAPDDQLRRCPRCRMKLWPIGEVRPLRFHHLRHTTASLLMMAGANPAATQRILRHSDPRITTEIYGHLAPGYLRSEVDLLSFGAPPALPTAPLPRPGAREKGTRFAAPVLQGPAEGPEEPSGEGEEALQIPEVPAVGVEGFEPPTPCSQSRCATRLRYTPNWTFLAQPCEQRAYACERSSAVADAVLLVAGQLGHVATVGQDEERVVAEAAPAARRARDVSLTLAPRQLDRRAVGPGERDHGDVARSAQAVGDGGEALQQEGVVARVIAWPAGEARRQDPGRASERIHLETAVVGERTEARLERRQTRLLGSVVLERRTVLLYLEARRHHGQREELERQARRELAQLGQLVPVAGRDDELHRSAARCASMSCAQPLAASAVSASSSARSNVPCSPVPWTSTNLPPSAITTFMSTPAAASST